MVLPDTVLAFKILEGAMINDNQRQMALTLAFYLSFKSDPIIKEEDAFYTTQKKYKEKNKKLNPLTKQGKVSRCAICDSKMH